MAAADAEPEATAGGDAESVDRLTVIVRAEVLQHVVNQMLTVVDEAIFRIGHDGLSVAAVDPANVAMIDLDLDAAAFESVGDGMFPIGLNLQKLDDYIGGASGSEPVSLSYRPEKRAIGIEHTNVEVEMAGIDPDAIRSEPELPDMDHTVNLTVDAGVFTDAAENAELVSDHVGFEALVDERELVVYGEGDTDDIRTVLGSEELPEANFDSDAESLYSLPYLVGGSTGNSKYAGILTPLDKGTDLCVEFSDEYPILMEYDFADGLGNVQMMLAPRIQSR